MSADQPGRQRRSRSQTRRRILDAAAEVFAVQGIAASSVNEIAQAAGLTKGAVYSNFASRDELVLAIMEEQLVRRAEDFIAAFEAEDELDAALTALANNLVDAMHTDVAWPHLLVEYWGMARRDPAMRAGLLHRRREGRRAVTEAIERACQKYGVELPMSASEFAIALMALSNGLAIEAGIDPEAVSVDTFARLVAVLGVVPTNRRGTTPDELTGTDQS